MTSFVFTKRSCFAHAHGIRLFNVFVHGSLALKTVSESALLGRITMRCSVINTGLPRDCNSDQRRLRGLVVVLREGAC